MQRTTKGTEPPCLAQYRPAGEADWDRDVRGDDKAAVRKKLCEEQRHLCCFCEGRIRPTADKMKVAHFVPQSVDPSLMFRWSNLFGACFGGQGEPPRRQHCDTKQGNQRLDSRLLPTQLAKGTIRFATTGRVIANDPALQAEIDQKLNLNLTRLVDNRKAAWEAMVQAMGKGKWTLADVQHKIDEMTSGNVVVRAEYQSYLLWWLERRLSNVGK